jgi:hypothetical protein
MPIRHSDVEPKRSRLARPSAIVLSERGRGGSARTASPAGLHLANELHARTLFGQRAPEHLDDAFDVVRRECRIHRRTFFPGNELSLQNVAKRGVESLALTMTLGADGTTSAPINISECAHKNNEGDGDPTGSRPSAAFLCLTVVERTEEHLSVLPSRHLATTFGERA